MKNKIVGQWGEAVAVNYLKNRGYKILQTNWRFKKSEIDIIAYKERVTAIEVKTRSKEGPPQSILKSSQVARIHLALKKYCLKNNHNYQQSRLDLIIITRKSRSLISLKHHLDI
jgi:putative endonuclease